MGKIKDGAKLGKVFALTEREMNYLRILNASLQFNTWKDKIISGFLYYVCTNRFGYPETANLIFEIDLDNDKNELIVKEIPDKAVKDALKKLQ